MICQREAHPQKVSIGWALNREGSTMAYKGAMEDIVDVMHTVWLKCIAKGALWLA